MMGDFEAGTNIKNLMGREEEDGIEISLSTEENSTNPDKIHSLW